MSLAVLRSRALAGMEAPAVNVEVHLARGLPSFTIVGLPDTEVRESKDRVRAALQNAGFEIPSRRITVNLAPADLPKESGRFDLPIALGILAASGQIPGDRARPLRVRGRAVAVWRAASDTRRAGDDLRHAQARARRAARLHPSAGERGRGGAGVRTPHIYPAAVAARGLRPFRRARRRLRAAAPSSAAVASSRRTIPTLPTSKASCTPSARWKWRRRAATAPCWSARPARARPCWLRALSACCRR